MAQDEEGYVIEIFTTMEKLLQSGTRIIKQQFTAEG